MKIKFFIPRWGNRHLSWADFTLKAKEAGYAGVEANLPVDEIEQEEMFEQLQLNDLSWIGQHFETATPNFEEHLQQYEVRLKALVNAKPLFINSQTGKDYFSFEQNSRLIELAAKISEEVGVAIYHETHRGKFSFCTTATASYLQKYPDLQLTADFSHWCCVAESYLQDQQEILNLAIERTAHFHCRVGYPGGPQVNNPTAPEWKEALDFHLQWWDVIVNRHLVENATTLTITCEFGPYPYMPQFPFSQKDVSDLWNVNLFMKNLLEKRYSAII
ncbi:sugar phosphate isomerase/epimerase [Pedobacter cryotolerans]|uniref:Sugar phosphate isomerase/epimerase n=1 Tax=Pedobacter cryotolerans TaxID=2571270 RepID=A0A4U1C7U3_9SPHI|nr:sugar phosphate isomerase/epimerase [Pedobacter cryotolerans]TKC01534.1 sugar phosphate isomerase/epimerase [Pedobacter cryotolerans]